MPVKRISELTAATQITASDVLPMVNGGATKKATPTLSSFSPATKVVAPASSGVMADYYTDGIADDVEINAALTSVSSTGGSVLVRSGTYIITSSIRPYSNTTLYGEGASTIFKYANGSTFNFLLRNHDAETTGNTNIILKDFAVNGNSANAGVGVPEDMITLRRASNCIIENVYVYDAPDSAFVIDKIESVDNIITNCIADTTGDIGIYISDTLRTIISNNIVKNTDSYGIRVIQYNAGGAFECVVNNNVLNLCGVGLNVASIRVMDGAEHTAVVGNTITASGGKGIEITTSGYSSINANNIYLSDREGIYIEDAQRGQVTGNTVHQSGRDTSNTYAGIHLLDVGDCAVIGNRSGDNGSGTRQKYGIEEAGTSDNNVITGNMLDRNGTAGAIIVGATTIARNNRGYITEASGTATITSGNTSVTITHGLSVTPTLDDISVIFGEQGTSDYGRFWISSITSTQFTINVSADPGASNLDLAWKAIVL